MKNITIIAVMALVVLGAFQMGRVVTPAYTPNTHTFLGVYEALDRAVNAEVTAKAKPGAYWWEATPPVLIVVDAWGYSYEARHLDDATPCGVESVRYSVSIGAVDTQYCVSPLPGEPLGGAR